MITWSYRFILYAVLCGSSLCFLRQIIRLINLFPCKHNVYLIVITQINKINEIYWWDFIWCIHSLMHWNDKCTTYFPKGSQKYVLYYYSNYHLEYLYELYGLLVGNDSNTNLIIFFNNNLQRNISLIVFQIALQYLVRPTFALRRPIQSFLFNLQLQTNLQNGILCFIFLCNNFLSCKPCARRTLLLRNMLLHWWQPDTIEVSRWRAFVEASRSETKSEFE